MARPHYASRLEDRVNSVLQGAVRRRGWQPQVIPFLGYGSERGVRLLARVVMSREAAQRYPPILPAGEQAAEQTVRGWRQFLAIPATKVTLTAELAGHRFEVQTDRGGYLDTVVELQLPAGRHELALRFGDRPPAIGVVTVPDPEADFGIVSDIDDTVMVTMLPRPLIAAWNTFVKDEQARRVVPGMAEMYRRLLAGHPGAPIFYLSTGAWNTVPNLSPFLQRHGYPLGPMLMTDWGPTNSGWFRSGSDHKREQLRRLAREFPRISWLLVGDDGQRDPLLYAEFANAEPDRVRAIALRELTPGEQLLSHGLPLPNTDPRRGEDAQAQTVANLAGAQSVDVVSASGVRVARAADGAGLLPLLEPMLATPRR